MNKETDSVNDFGKYLEGKPAYKIYTNTKKYFLKEVKECCLVKRCLFILGHRMTMN